MEKNLEEIKKDIKKWLDVSKINFEDAFQVHFGVCGEIRNKYLWCNRPLAEKLMKDYEVRDVDTLSHKILEEVLEEIKKEDIS